MVQFLKQELTTDPLWKAGLFCIREAMTTFIYRASWEGL